MRDIERAYRDATIAEYQSLKGSGRAADAAHVAGVLREQYGYEVEPAAPEPVRPTGDEDAEPPTVVEHADVEAPPETVVETQAGPRAPRPQSARKTAAAKPRPTTGK